jgi:serine O-acetyltransferase
MTISALSLHRLAHRLWKWNVPIVPRLIDHIVHVVFTASLPHTAEIGEGTVFLHRGMGVIIDFEQRIGKRVIIGPFVAIGGRHGPSRPVIEDDVVIGAHALILGDITIGEGSAVAAGAVVTKDVPPRGVVVGNPAKLVRISETNMSDYLAATTAEWYAQRPHMKRPAGPSALPGPVDDSATEPEQRRSA